MEWTLLSSLTADEQMRVISQTHRRRFRKGEIIFHEGDPGDSLHLIAKGHVAVRRSTPLGDVATLLVLGPGDFFGEMALLDRGPRHATVIADGPVAVPSSSAGASKFCTTLFTYETKYASKATPPTTASAAALITMVFTVPPSIRQAREGM